MTHDVIACFAGAGFMGLLLGLLLGLIARKR